MVAEPLLRSSGYRRGEGGVLSDLRVIDAGIDTALLARAEALLDWVEEHELAPFPELRSAELDTGVDAYAQAEAEEFLGRARTGGPVEGPPTGRPAAIAGDGAPMVADLDLVDLAAVLRRGVVSATRLVGAVTELAYRLPLVWARIREGEVALWRGIRVAEKTIKVSWAAAADVDADLVAVLGSCSWAQVDRCVQAAIERHAPLEDSPDPQDETRDAVPVEDDRCFDVHLRDAGNSDQLFTHTGASGIGLVGAEGTLEAADALDVEHAIRDLAQQLAEAGSREPLGVRRAKALGMLARGEVPLPTSNTSDSSTTDSSTGPTTAGAQVATGQGTAFGLPTTPAAPAVPAAPAGTAPAAPGSRRNVLLVLHLSETALIGGERVGRCENTLAPVSIDQIKDWCAGAKVKVQPVLDVAEHHPVGTYEIPDRIRAQVTYRDLECVFPHCHTPVRSCDLDHIVPFDEGGPTCACNLAPLCRRHHRVKTARRWAYVMVHPGSYYWRAPSGASYLVDAHGTHQLPNLTDEGAAHRYRHPCPSETAAPTASQGRERPRLSHRRTGATSGRDGPSTGPPPRPDPPPPF